MIVIKHFVNLVGWEEIEEICESGCGGGIKHELICDSISLGWLCRMFGLRVEVESGVDAFHSASWDFSNTCFWTSENCSLSALVLPYFADRFDIDRFVMSISKSEIIKQNLVIGISSPKQNYLATEYAKSLAESNGLVIWCLGAAIYTDESYFSTMVPKWVRFLYVSPRRTLGKFLQMALVVVKLLSPAYRSKFQRFLWKIALSNEI